LSVVNRFYMALLYGRAGHLTANNGGFRPGQWRRSTPTRTTSRPSTPARCGAAPTRATRSEGRLARVLLARALNREPTPTVRERAP
jgi:hypothetical protein